MPCNQVSYGLSLSYAQLSQFNIHRLALSSQSQKLRVKDTFKKALEASQRVDPGLAYSFALAILLEAICLQRVNRFDYIC